MLEFPTLNRKTVFQRLANAETTVIAANRRLVRDCLWRYGLWQQSLGLRVWPTPKVMTFDDLLQSQWQQQLLTSHASLWPQPTRVLSPLDCRRLWQTIIEQNDGDTLLRISESARLAFEAFELETSFDLPDSALQSDDVCRYREWRRHFNARLQQHQWLTPAQLQRQLVHAFIATETQRGQHWLMLGFDDQAPLLQKWCSALITRGDAIETVRESAPASCEQRVQFLDRQHELISAIRWAVKQADNGLRVAIVVPDLSAKRQAVERVLRQEVDPSAATSFTALTKGRYNVSAGGALSEQAMVNTAFLLWRLLNQSRNWSLLDLSQLLTSAYWGDYSRDGALRARLDLKWRDRGEAESRVAFVLQQIEHAGATALHRALVQAHHEAQQWPSRAQPSQWAELLQNVLHTVGWPGTRTLDSVDWQVRNAFEEVLLSVAQLDEVCGRISVNDMLVYLRQLCDESIFQAQANALAPIQVLGMLEVSGQWFDCIWVTHMADEQLPAPPKPNPFIPITLQKQFHLPRSSIEHEWAYVQRWQHSLRFSCQQLVWSCAERDGDQALRSSALIRDVTSCALDDLIAPAAPPLCAPLEVIEHESAVPFAPDETVKGGVHALRAQALNPFAAFAEFRLNANALPPITTFTTPRVHGLLLHAALQALWQQWPDQATMLALSETETALAIEQAIDAAFIAIEQSEHRRLPPMWRRLEQDLLSKILRDWLPLERARPPFHIHALEHPLQWQQQHWTFSVRVDRIDRDANGLLLVIDYKSGAAPSPQQWLQTPLFEPQLPLYALALGEKVDAISFAQLKRGDMKFKGCADSEGWATGIKSLPAWPQLVVQWRDQIDQLATAYLNGEVSNQYWSLRDLQRHPLRALLRVPTSLSLDEEQGASS